MQRREKLKANAAKSKFKEPLKRRVVAALGSQGATANTAAEEVEGEPGEAGSSIPTPKSPRPKPSR